MKEQLITLKQFKALAELESVAHEVRGFGYAREFQAFIEQLKSGGIDRGSTDPRVNQAKRLWDLGISREIGFNTFLEYLRTIPEIPKHLKGNDGNYQLLLEESRVGFDTLAIIFKYEFEPGVNPDKMVPVNTRHQMSSVPRWIRVKTLASFEPQTAEQVVGGLKEGEYALNIRQGLLMVALYPEMLPKPSFPGGYGLMCSGTVHVDDYPRTVVLRFDSGAGIIDGLHSRRTYHGLTTAIYHS